LVVPGRRGGIEVRRFVTAVVGVVLVAGCNVYAPGWSSIHADAGNSDYSPVTGAGDVTLAWHRDLGGAINVGGTNDGASRVYVTANNPACPLSALDAATGAVQWCTDEVDFFAVVSSPLVDNDGRIYVADGEAMHSFDEDGNLLWQTPIEGVPLSAQFTPNGRVLFVTNIGRIYVLARGSGAPILPVVELIPGATWDPADGLQACARGTADCPSANTPAVDLRTGRFFFTFWEPGAPQAGVRAMQITEDPVPAITPLWTNDALPGGTASSPTLSTDGSRVYVNDNAGGQRALDAETGAEVWSYPIGFATGGSPSASPQGLVMPSGGGNSPVLALRDEGDHATLAWRADALLNRGIATQTAGNLAYVTVSTGNFQNDLVVVDTTDGTELDREPIPGISIFTVGTTIGVDGTVYVPTLLGDLYAYRPA
jgi:outer membrane protein assembly factor BamB